MKEIAEKLIHIPQIISLPEWQEILRMQQVQDAFEIPLNEQDEKFLPGLYGAKFMFEDSDHDVIGDLYIIQSDELRTLPVVLVKYHGFLPVNRDE